MLLIAYVSQYEYVYKCFQCTRYKHIILINVFYFVYRDLFSETTEHLINCVKTERNKLTVQNTIFC